MMKDWSSESDWTGWGNGIFTGTQACFVQKA